MLLQRSSTLKPLDNNIIAAARERDLALFADMVMNHGVPVDFQESPVRFKFAQMF